VSLNNLYMYRRFLAFREGEVILQTRRNITIPRKAGAIDNGLPAIARAYKAFREEHPEPPESLTR
jgi:hypothetical protein